jgi:hypothetical protein
MVRVRVFITQIVGFYFIFSKKSRRGRRVQSLKFISDDMGHGVPNVPSKEIQNIMHEDTYTFKWLWGLFIVQLLFSSGQGNRRD